ncbi:AAA family ATPase [Haliangium sp.]|uniref:AAA family ATPase n=1 Tax=Haliangium sp. TaxID=2663208 RepID=UPI003D0F3CF4
MSDPTPPFELLDPADAERAERRDALDARAIPEMRSLAATAERFQPSPELVDAINVALALGAPLLLTGEPGTGKTQVGHYVAWYFGAKLFPLFVRSTTTAEDLFYHFDAVAYLHAAQEARAGQIDLAVVKQRLVHEGKGALWKAFESERTAVVLIDEIDKAPRDFPNDLLNPIDQLEFRVRELDHTVPCNKPPFIVITSNSERRLPEPFLRRCVVHHIELTDELLQAAVAAHAGSFPHLDEDLVRTALGRFLELRTYDLRKPPATAELLAWLAVLSARGDADADQLATCALSELPALVTLVKDRDDHALLR